MKCPVDTERHDKGEHTFDPKRSGVSARLYCNECNRYVHVDD